MPCIIPQCSPHAGQEPPPLSANCSARITLYFGDYLDILKRHISDESVELLDLRNASYTAHTPEYVEAFYKYVEEGTGRRYRLGDLTNPNKNRPNRTCMFLELPRPTQKNRGAFA